MYVYIGILVTCLGQLWFCLQGLSLCYTPLIPPPHTVQTVPTKEYLSLKKRRPPPPLVQLRCLFPVCITALSAVYCSSCLYNCQEPILQHSYTDREMMTTGCAFSFKRIAISSLIQTVQILKRERLTRLRMHGQNL